MNKKFTKLIAALALLVFMTPAMAGWGQTRSTTTFSYSAYSGQGTSGSGSECTATQSGITITSSKAYCASDHVKEYGGNNASTITFTSNSTITSIEISFKSSYAGNFVVPEGQPGSYSVSNNKGTWSGSSTSVTLTNTANGQARWTQIDVTYTSTDPEIAVDGTLTVTPAAVTNGELSVSYENITPTSGTITLFDAQDNDITSSCTWFTPSFNSDLSKVTYTATDNTTGVVNSLRMHLAVTDGTKNASADVTITQDFILTTMDQIFARATANGSTEKDVTIRFNNWEVSDINNSSSQYATKAWLTDGTKGCVIFCTSSSYAKFKVNDKLNGTVNCKLKLNTGYAQISSLVSGNDGTTATPGLTVTNDETPVNPVTGATIAGLSAVNTGSVVAFTGLTCQSSSYNYSTGYTLTDGTNTIYVKRNVNSFELTNEATYNVTGVFENNTTGKFIYPRSDDDITEVTIPAITVAPQSLSSFTYCEGDGPSAAQTITVSGDNLEGNIALALNNGENSAFEISLSENSGYASTLNLTQANGTVGETTVYVRLKAGLAIANDYEDEINLTSTNALAKTVSLAGIVTAPMVTWNLATNSYSSASTTEVNWTSNYVNMTLAKGESSTHANNYLGGGSNDHTRFYQKQVLSFTPVSGYAISSIEIISTSSTYAGYFTNSSATWTNASATSSNTKVTVTPTNGNNTVSVTIGTATRATSVTVYYEASTLVPHDITNSIYMENGTVVASHSSAVEGTIVTLTVYPAAGYHLENVGYIDVVLSATPGTSVAITQVNDGTFTFTMPDEDVTVVALFTEYSGTYYTLVNSADDLIPGRHYIIASSKNAGAAYAMGAQNGSYREQVAVNVVGNFIYGKPSGLREVVLSGDNTNLWTLYDDGTGTVSKGYLYAVSGNGLKCRTDNTSNDNGKWTISITEGVATIVSQISGTDVSNTIKYNAGSSRFSCYTPSSGMSLVYLFMKADETDYEFYSNTTFDDLTIGELDIYTVHSPATLEVTGTLSNEGDHENLIIEDGAQLYTEDVVEATIKKNISAYDPSLVGQGVSNGWYFISYPLNCDYAGDAPTEVTNMIANPATNYDLYKLVDNTWANYKQNEGETNIDPGFTLYTGHGYLYANANDVTLEFAGSLNYPEPEISLEIGYNLVGNPYAYNAYPSVSYYKMNDDHTAITADLCTDVVLPCTGIIVDNRDGSITDITFSKNQPVGGAFNGSIQMTLAQQATNRGTAATLDNAIVSFNEGSQLGKFYFGTQNANLYIPQGTGEYAIVSSEAQGEMPVNFRANENGEYILSVNAKNVEMNYLHLIDNMTGMDIDLLATPSYTFNATTKDYESRFKLVFASANENADGSNETFAFFSDGNLIIANNGEATLQVLDMQGRVVSSQAINGSESVKVSATAGVYVLRLINGENVRVQKIVVR